MEGTEVESVEGPPPERTCQRNSIQKQKLKFTASKNANVSTRAARPWLKKMCRMDCHLRKRDDQVEVQVNEPETGLLPTNV